MVIFAETGIWADRYVKERNHELNMPTGATVSDVIVRLGIPAEEAGFAVLEGVAVQKNYILKDGDKIKLHPVIIGG